MYFGTTYHDNDFAFEVTVSSRDMIELNWGKQQPTRGTINFTNENVSRGFTSASSVSDKELYMTVNTLTTRMLQFQVEEISGPNRMIRVDLHTR